MSLFGDKIEKFEFCKQRIHLPAVMLLIFSAVGLASHSQPPLAQGLPSFTEIKIESSILDETRTINIWTPNISSDSLSELPVLYLLDGGIREDFPHVVRTIEELVNQNKIEPLILVGLENTYRRRDLTGPTTRRHDKKIAPIVGESANFRAFIEKELIPYINQSYSNSGRRGIIGESLAGLFITETLLLEPELFDFYIAFDPSLWWNGHHLLNNATQFLPSNYNSQKTFWFAGSSARDIYKYTKRLAVTLCEKETHNLEWSFSPQPHEKHSTIFKATKEEALIWTLGKNVE